MDDRQEMMGQRFSFPPLAVGRLVLDKGAMYTELKEVCNFLCRYLHLRIPQAKVGIFAESLGNVLLQQYHDFWDVSDPKKFEEYRLLSPTVGPDDSNSLKKAAASVALSFEELMACLPERIVIYVNPGEVLFATSGQSTPMEIWTGTVDADRSYHPEPECVLGAKMTASETKLAGGDPFKKGTFKFLPGKRATVQEILDGSAFRTASHDKPVPVYLSDEALVDWFMQLVPVDCIELGTLSPFPYDGNFRMFRYVSPSTAGMNFNVEKFAVTRFGSFRKRPDHESLRRLRSAMSGKDKVSPVKVQSSLASLASNSDGSQSNYHNSTSSQGSIISCRGNSAMDLCSGPPAPTYSFPTLAPLASQMPVPPAAPWTPPFKPVTPQRHSLTSLFSGLPGMHESLSSLSTEQERAVLSLIEMVRNGSSSR